MLLTVVGKSELRRSVLTRLLLALPALDGRDSKLDDEHENQESNADAIRDGNVETESEQRDRRQNGLAHG